MWVSSSLPRVRMLRRRAGGGRTGAGGGGRVAGPAPAGAPARRQPSLVSDQPPALGASARRQSSGSSQQSTAHTRPLRRRTAQRCRPLRIPPALRGSSGRPARCLTPHAAASQRMRLVLAAAARTRDPAAPGGGRAHASVAQPSAEALRPYRRRLCSRGRGHRRQRLARRKRSAPKIGDGAKRLCTHRAAQPLRVRPTASTGPENGCNPRSGTAQRE